MSKLRDNHSGVGVVAVLLLLVAIIGASSAGFYVWSSNHDVTDEPDTETAVNDDDGTTSSRNTDQKIINDMARIGAEISQYAANNNGRRPMTNVEIDDFEADYLNDELAHPESNLPYTINQIKGDGGYHYITYRTGICEADGTIGLTDSTRQFVLQAELTGGDLYCMDL